MSNLFSTFSNFLAPIRLGVSLLLFTTVVAHAKDKGELSDKKKGLNASKQFVAKGVTGINIYKNDDNKVLYIEIPANYTKLQTQIISVKGDSIYNKCIGAGISSVNIKKWKRGTYEIKLSDLNNKTIYSNTIFVDL